MRMLLLTVAFVGVAVSASAAIDFELPRRRIEKLLAAELPAQALTVTGIRVGSAQPVPPPIDEEYKLAIGPVLDQGSSNFCWIFAGFLAARDYYRSAAGDDAARWRSFLAPLDDAEKLREFAVAETGEEDILGWPSDAFYFFGKKLPGVAVPWHSLVPSETRSGWGPHPEPDVHPYTPPAYFLPMAELLERVRGSLRRGAPVAHCTPYHCVMIFGGSYAAGQAIRYWIADPLRARVYEKDAAEIHRGLADVTVLAPDLSAP